MIWKVEYYKNESDWRNDIKTVAEFDNFESAVDFTNSVTGNHLGAVRLVHPNVE